MICETKRLYLREWSLEDLDQALELWGDPYVMEFMDVRGGLSKPQVLEKLKEQIQCQEKYGVQSWAVVSKEGDEIIGCCGLRPYNLQERVFELGFHFMKKVWGQGYALEAAEAVIRYAFEKLKIPKLFAGHHPKNSASKKLLLKLGFHHVREELYPPTGLMHPSYELENSSQSH